MTQTTCGLATRTLLRRPSRECCFVSYTERSMETVHCRIATQPDRAQPLSTRPHTPSTLALLRSHNCSASRFRLHLHDTCLIATARDARHCYRHASSLSIVQMESACDFVVVTSCCGHRSDAICGYRTCCDHRLSAICGVYRAGAGCVVGGS